jgi:hypothetical protein
MTPYDKAGNKLEEEEVKRYIDYIVAETYTYQRQYILAFFNSGP